MAQAIRLNWPQPGNDAFLPDAAQQAVIGHDRGHLRVLAGPGTGKTSVIVAAVKERIRRGDAPGSMLVLTYGRMAAEELRQRLTTGGHPVPVTTTFHSLAYRIIQAQEPGLRLMGAPEQEAVLREILARTDHLPAVLEPARTSRGLAEQVRRFIAGAQARGMAPPDSGGDDELTRAAEAMFGEYLDIIGLAATMDYSELIRQATRLLAENPPESVRKLRAIFVDEYQDTDPAQVVFLQQLARHGAEVTAVGDPDQAIYGFRGADSTGILRFDEVFAAPGCTTIALDTTRRFGPQIAAVAGRVVPKNALGSIGVAHTRAHRQPRAAGGEGQVAYRLYESEAAQADHIADLLRHVQAGSSEVFPGVELGWSQMAVLVRSGQRDLPILQRAMAAAGIPVEVARDDIPVARQPAVRPLLDLLKAAGDVDGGLTGERAAALLGSPLCGLDSREISRVARLLRQQAAHDGEGPPPLSTQLLADCLVRPELLAGVDEHLARRVGDLADLLDRARDSCAQTTPARTLEMIWNATSWPQRLRRDALAGGRRAREANQALDAVMELFDQAQHMDLAFESVRTVGGFLEQLDNQAIPAAPDRQKSWNRNAVRLLTAHRSKGSQWPLVIVAGVQEGLWPDLRPRPTLLGAPDPMGWREQQMLEERRLFFVACTRACEALLVCAVRSSTEDGPAPSAFMTLAAGPLEPTMVPGRPTRPLTPTGVVAGLREKWLDSDTSPALRQAVWERLQILAQRTDDHDRQVFPWADPQRWWGHRTWTRNDRAWYDADQPLTLSASSIERYVQCPRRWFLERKVQAAEAASTKMAFGNILHLCAQAIAGGELQPDEQHVAEVLDGVWHAVGYAPGWQERYEREEAQKATRRLLTWMKNCAGEFVGAEIPFDALLDLDSGETVRLTGKTDRVDRSDGQLVITDFKTGGTAISGPQAQEHIQLGLYRWVAELGALGVPGEAVAQLLYVRHDPPAKHAEHGAKTLRQDTPDVPEWIGPILDSAAAGIRAELAVARPGPGCRTCVVATSCPALPQGEEVRP